ncbi:hypothetical protein FRACA_4700002 [Frankia canadensis]|uniref:Uncharacterized protein n=1 Tax=Frankia canadensis TaxID=1836972 RepID=A0A2I2KXV7_9ACTN|nr:hypothetical protein FRACA_4700002 [Frankia canadensis]SOU57788.1 hypothetical protein FRACA_4700002 [Frankia canadensis]
MARGSAGRGRAGVEVTEPVSVTMAALTTPPPLLRACRWWSLCPWGGAVPPDRGGWFAGRGSRLGWRSRSVGEPGWSHSPAGFPLCRRVRPGVGADISGIR